ncbi:MAG: hypothetical protein JO112_06300, partial [Planctomycetes bacterium]|nr:hypothetical protein [Planctomycetota bacterium]
WLTTANTTLTIASGITVHGQSGYIGYSPNFGGPTSVAIINQGTIQADAAHGIVTIYGMGNKNTGTLKAIGGGTLSLQGTFTNTGTVTIDPTGTLSLNGTLSGGTITPQAGAQIYGSTLDGVTVNGDFQVVGNNALAIQNGLTLNGALTLGGNTGFGYLTFQGTQTLGGAGTVIFTSDSRNALWLTTANTALTIASGITVHGQSGYIGYDPNYGGSTSVSVINQGTIQADVSGANIFVYGSGGPFTNSGTVKASLGTINIYTGTFSTVNTGTLAVGPTGTLSISGPFTQSSTGNFNVVLGGSTTGLYGQAAVSGPATLDGTLNVSEANNFSPGTGNNFTILTYTSATGQFANYTGLTLPGTAALQPAYNPGSVTLTTVTSTTIAPDLRVTNLALSPTNPQSSQNVTVTWNDLNDGNGATGGSWTDHVVVTNTTTGQTIVTADVPYNAAQNGNLAPNSSAAQTYSFRLPDGPAGAGNLQVQVTTDYYNTIAEYYPGNVGESNNTTTITAASALAAYPDLQVSGLSVATTNPQSGQNLTINWKDANTGQAATAGNWSDQVTIVNSTTGQTLVTADVPYNATTSGNLQPGSMSPQLSYTFRLPDGSAGVGNLQIAVTTNVNGDVYEYNTAGTATSNNTATTTAVSTLAPYPDLQVTGLAVTPASPQSGSTLIITWSDANTGDAPVVSAFNDHVIVDNLTTGEPLVDALLPYDPTAVGKAALGAGASLSQQYTFKLPDGTAGTGQLQITVETNALNQFFEYNASGTAESNNTATLTETSALSSYPDLAVSNVTVPVSVLPGQQVNVSWTLSNVGGAAAAGPWTEQVLLAEDAAGDNATLLATQTNSGPLAAGETVPR